jgi:hypothetical protein
MSTDNKPHWRTVIKRIDPAYLYAEDLGPAGTKVDVEVTAAGIGKVKNPGSAKEVVWIGFAGHAKKLGLNATNAKTMEAVFGSGHWGDWRGWITLVVIHKDAMRDPTADGGTSPMDVIRIAPTRPTKPRSQAVEHPLVARFDGCTTREQFDAADHDMRAVWAQIPKGAERSAVGAAFDRAKVRVRAAQSSAGPEEQAEILRQEASEHR